jgi:uncharacterized protein (TIGR03435 family)
LRSSLALAVAFVSPYKILRVKLTGPIRRSNFYATLLALFAVASLAFSQSAAPPAIAPQPPAAQPQVFEVAAVRMVKDHDAEYLAQGIQPMTWSSFPTNRFSAHNMPLSNLLMIAYGVSDKNITGGPGWLDSQEYDVDAKVEGDRQLTLKEMQPLLQTLLAQRLHLTAHHVTKMYSGYALVIAKGGPKLQTSAEGVRPRAQVHPNGFQVWHMDAKGIATVSSAPAGGPIVDKTGLTGTYDVTLSYAPANDPNSNLPSFFTALQEQLGLKLESQEVPVDFLIIDHVERTPTEN